MGNVATTVSGRKCQAWTSDSPHEHRYDSDSMYPDGTVREAGNKCRNPDSGWNVGVWCYTTDPNQEWELCDVPLCRQEGEFILEVCMGIRNPMPMGFPWNSYGIPTGMEVVLDYKWEWEWE